MTFASTHFAATRFTASLFPGLV